MAPEDWKQFVRLVDECPACGEQYGMSETTTDSEGRLVHWLCEPENRAEYLRTLRIVIPSPHWRALADTLKPVAGLRWGES